MTPFEITRTGNQARVKIHDKLTAVEIPQLQPALKDEIASGVREMTFDLAGVRALDSTGIGLLIAASNSMSAVQGSISIINVSAEILKLLQNMRLVSRLHATGNGKEATHE